MNSFLMSIKYFISSNCNNWYDKITFDHKQEHFTNVGDFVLAFVGPHPLLKHDIYIYNLLLNPELG